MAREIPGDNNYCSIRLITKKEEEKSVWRRNKKKSKRQSAQSG